MAKYRPQMSDAGIHRLHTTTVVDETGESRNVSLTGERPLTIYLNTIEIVTLMTLGSQPELLTLGYLRNQGLVDKLEDVESIQVDWDVEAVAVTTTTAKDNIETLTSRRTVTSGCGQGTMSCDGLFSAAETAMPGIQRRVDLCRAESLDRI